MIEIVTKISQKNWMNIKSIGNRIACEEGRRKYKTKARICEMINVGYLESIP